MKYTFSTDITRQALTMHAQYLTSWASDLGGNHISCTPLATELASIDYVLSYRVGARQSIREIECKTDSHAAHNLCIELATNIPASALTELPTYPLSPEDSQWSAAFAVITAVGSGTIGGSFGLAGTDVGSSHLLSYLYPSCWLLLPTAALQDNIRQNFRDYRLKVTVSDNAWGSVSALVPVASVSDLVIERRER